MSNRKIFGIGLSKTGTTSLFVALAQLGYKAGTFRHMAKLGLESWFEGDFSHDYIKKFDALTDLPLAGFYKELDKRYPGSLFILTQRDIDSWLVSCERQFSHVPKIEFGRKINLFVYGCENFDREKFIHTYNRHYSECIQYFEGRENNFLCMDFFSGDSWSKLCSFLEKECPDIPFPNVKPGYWLKNEKPKKRRKKIRKLKRKLKRNIRRIVRKFITQSSL